jgi:hypothetical protein
VNAESPIRSHTWRKFIYSWLLPILLLIFPGITLVISKTYYERRMLHEGMQLHQDYQDLLEDFAKRSRMGSDIMVNDLNTLQMDIGSLTTEQVRERLNKLEKTSTSLQKEVYSISQLISPHSVDDILTLGKMREEVLARRDFEDRVNHLIADLEGRISNTERRIDTMTYWILGLLVSLISLSGALILILARRSGLVLKHNSQAEAEQEGNH